MGSDNLAKIVVYLGSFLICFFALSSVDFARFLLPRKTNYGQLLLVLFSVALAYLVANFLFGLSLHQLIQP